jgi:hypothetical protein
MADSNTKRPYVCSKIHLGTFSAITQPPHTFGLRTTGLEWRTRLLAQKTRDAEGISQVKTEPEGVFGAISILSKTAEHIRHIKKKIHDKHRLAESSSQNAVKDTTKDACGETPKPLKLDREPRKLLCPVARCQSAKREVPPKSETAARSRPTSAHAWNLKVRRQQEADKSVLLNQHLHLEGMDFTPMSSLSMTIDLHNKQYSRTLRELKAHRPTSHREVKSAHRDLQSRRPAYSNLRAPLSSGRRMGGSSSKNSFYCSSKGSGDHSYTDITNENSCLTISKAPTKPRPSKLPPRPPRPGVETQTDRLLTPLTVFGILEDDEVESPQTVARYL